VLLGACVMSRILFAFYGEVIHPIGSVTAVWMTTPTMNHKAYPTAKRTLAFTGAPLDSRLEIDG